MKNGENRGKGAEISSIYWYIQNRQEDVKNSIGNGVAKELICMTHGHELRRGLLEGVGGIRWRGTKGNKLG